MQWGTSCVHCHVWELAHRCQPPYPSICPSSTQCESVVTAANTQVYHVLIMHSSPHTTSWSYGSTRHTTLQATHHTTAQHSAAIAEKPTLAATHLPQQPSALELHCTQCLQLMHACAPAEQWATTVAAVHIHAISCMKSTPDLLQRIAPHHIYLNLVGCNK